MFENIEIAFFKATLPANQSDNLFPLYKLIWLTSSDDRYGDHEDCCV